MKPRQYLKPNSKEHLKKLVKPGYGDQMYGWRWGIWVLAFIFQGIGFRLSPQPTDSLVTLVLLLILLLMGMLPFVLWGFISFFWRHLWSNRGAGLFMLVAEALARLLWLPQVQKEGLDFVALRWPMFQIIIFWPLGLYLGWCLHSLMDKRREA